MPAIAVLDVILAIATLLDELCVYALQSVGAAGHPIRERVLSLLVDREHANRDELASSIADDDAVPGDDVDRLAVELHHRHLPILEEELFLEYDHRSGDVVRWKDRDAVVDAIESAD